MTFDYYTGAQAEQFSFIRIPKLLLLHETFSHLSIQAKLLYAVLLDRMSLSVKNHWVDSKNRAYITCRTWDLPERKRWTYWRS